MFAMKHNTYVIRWPVNYTNWINRPKNYKLAIMTDPLFWHYYVDGAEMFISSNINIDLGTTNDTMSI